MNHDPSDQPNLPMSGESAPINVPTFACIVYVSPSPSGVHARVANLPGIEYDAPSEREALSKIVPAFKERVAQMARDQTPIPWIDPPLPTESNEQKRFIPVHL